MTHPLHNRTRDLVGLSFTAASLWLAAPATAQHGHNTDAVRLEAHGTLSAYEGLGGGVRAEFAVAPQGVIPNFEDDISLTVGGEAILFFDDDNDRPDRDDDEGIGLWVPGAVQWNFYLSPQWSLFPEIGIWLQFGEDGHGHEDDDFDMDLLVGLGGRYHMGGRSAILIRIEHPGLFHVGVQF